MRKLLATLCLIAVLAPVPADASVSPGQFVVRCPYSHTLPDDPIVLPGQPGASHLHDFFGNETVDAHSTAESLLAGDTTCRVASDTAGYWTPTAYLNGQQIRPTVMRIYYLGWPHLEVETIPSGLQVIGGNRLATSPEENPHVRWYCGETVRVKTPRLPEPYDCRPWASQYAFVDSVIAIIEMPSCWNGTGLTPEDVAYPDDSGCPAEFPHHIPRLSVRVHFGILNPLNPDGTVALTLSSGPFYTMHADFWNTWQQERLDELVEGCLAAHVRCKAIDTGAEVEWVAQFGTTRDDVAAAVAIGEKGPFVVGWTDDQLPGQQAHRGSDMFVRAYDQAGNERWTRQFGTSGMDQALAVSVADDGVYVAGFTDGRFPKHEAKGGQDIVVAKFGLLGRLLWVRQFGTRANDRAMAIAVGQGGIYVAGMTGGPLGRNRAGGMDAFVARLISTGETVWVRQFGSEGSDEATGVAALGPRVYVVGSTDGALGRPTPLGGVDAFVRPMRADGSVVWTRQFGTAGNDRATSVSAPGQNVYVTGWTDGAFPKTLPAGGTDAFVRLYDPFGTPGWTDQFGSSADDEAISLVVDRRGVYVAGSTMSALSGQEQVGPSGGFLRKYLGKGTELWTLPFGTGGDDRVYGAAVDRRGLSVVGATYGNFEGQANAGDRDAFVVRVRFT